MKAVIFSGTTEGRELSHALAKAGADVVVSVASEVGAEEQGSAEGISISEGRKDLSQIRSLIRDADLVVDATHPYAVVVTETIRQAAAAEGVELMRLIRDSAGPWEAAEAASDRGQPLAEDDAGIRAKNHNAEAQACDSADDPADGAVTRADIRMAASAAEAARLAREIAGPGGHILLTTGSKDLPVFAGVNDAAHLFPRVLPLTASIEACEAADIPHRNIIAVQGPFSEELNRAVIRDYSIDVLVTKESGRTGGFLEKIRACAACGIPAVVIARPMEDGMRFEEVLSACRERMK